MTQPSVILSLGLDILRLGNNHNRGLNEEELFVSYYGASPGTCAALFVQLQRSMHVTEPNAQHFLMALYWLNTNSTAVQIAFVFDIDEKTVQNCVWQYTRAIQALERNQSERNN
jgi:hypothetical protein